MRVLRCNNCSQIMFVRDEDYNKLSSIDKVFAAKICEDCASKIAVTYQVVVKEDMTVYNILKEFSEALRNAKTEQEIAKAYDEVKEKLFSFNIDANEFGLYEDRKVTKIFKVGEIDNKEIFVEIAKDYSEIFRIF
ncbi:MAG: hypothetical protein QXR93_06850 [Archaeoglobaceae archaeon]